MIYFIILGCIVLLFGAVVFRGAPYVPTLRRSVSDALDLLNLKHDALVIDLGSGDGSVLKAAARRGYRALGYEINPVLYLIAKLRCLPQKSRVTVRLRDFWLADWPNDAQAVFVFLAGPHMKHLARKLKKEMTTRRDPLFVVSYGFAIPGHLPKKISRGMYLYELKPTALPDDHGPVWNPPLPRPKLPIPKLWRRK